MPSHVSKPAAQFMCDSFEPVDGVETPILDRDKLLWIFNHKSEEKEKTPFLYEWYSTEGHSLYSLKVNCTLIYRKELNYRLRLPNRIGSSCTHDGIIVTEQLPNFSFCDESSNPNDVDVNTFFWDKRVKLQLPVIKYVMKDKDNNTKDTRFYINYYEDEYIDGLKYKQTNDKVYNVTTANLYIADLDSDYYAEYTRIPAMLDVLFPYVLFPYFEHQKLRFVTPIHLTSKVPIKVPPRADKLLHEVSKDLASKTVDNFIGLAMQRMQSNRQGDLLLCF